MNRVDVRRVKESNNFKYIKVSILYWMQRDKRVSDNWALLYAQQLAIEKNTTLHVCFSLNGNFPKANVRQYSFMVHGLIETAQKLEDLNIKFSLFIEKSFSFANFINFSISSISELMYMNLFFLIMFKIFSLSKNA